MGGNQALGHAAPRSIALAFERRRVGSQDQGGFNFRISALRSPECKETHRISREDTSSPVCGTLLAHSFNTRMRWRRGLIQLAHCANLNDNLDDHTQASGSLNRVNIVCHLIESAASTYDLPLVFQIRLIWQESRFDLGAVSPASAQGVAQFMPGTAIQTGLANPFDAGDRRERWRPRCSTVRLRKSQRK
jgi:hypothetical protein